MKYKNMYYTKNVQHSALLLAMKQNLESCYWQNGECVFVFNNEDECKKIILHLQNHKIHVEAMSLFEALKTINTILILRHQQ